MFTAHQHLPGPHLQDMTDMRREALQADWVSVALVHHPKMTFDDKAVQNMTPEEYGAFSDFKFEGRTYYLN